MSIMQNEEYHFHKNLKPVAPSWFRGERYDYCERLDGSSNASKRGLFFRLTGKKRNK